MRIWTSEIVNKVGEEVELAGWVNARRDHGKLIFIDLRDKSGIAQLVFTPPATSEVGAYRIYDLADDLRPEYVIKVRGIIKKRPKGMENPDLETGEYEVAIDTSDNQALEILSDAKTPPFELDTDGYKVNEEIRMQYRYLDLRRERLRGNLEVRAKIIKFIRDFLTKNDFFEIETPILGKSTPEGARDYLVPSRLQPGKFYALPQSPQQYKQLLMIAGLERYFQIARCFRDEDTRGDRQPEFSQLDIEMSFVEEEEILSLVENLIRQLVEELYPSCRIAEFPFPRMAYRDVVKWHNSDKPDLRKDKQNPKELAFAFIVDFPMFEWKESEKRWDAFHHPFTQPKVKDYIEFNEKFKDDPAAILARQYDLVLNHHEIGGGSIRTHNSDLLQSVFRVMGNTEAEILAKFGHFWNAFNYGVPPHGGIALGLDRFIAILQNEPSIREVIAFPKTGDGRDLMMGAPSEVDKSQLKELHIEIAKPGESKKSQ